MILIRIEKISEIDAIVIGQHFMPETLTDEEKMRGILVNSIPSEPPVGLRQYNVLHINPTTKEMWYETLTESKTKEELQAEEMANLKAQNQILTQQQASMSADFQAFMDMYFEQNPTV